MFLKFFYPPKCLFCHRILSPNEDQIICSLCAHQLEEHTKAFATLQKVSLKATSLFSYEETESLPILYLTTYSQSRSAIKRWKYQGNRGYAKKFAHLMTHQFDFSQFDAPIFVPIPISPNRMKERGFNHAYDLATQLSKLTHIPVYNGLKRIRNTKKQSLMASPKERYENIKNCMVLAPDKRHALSFPVRSILLVDDIYTTGSTMREAMRVLMQEESFKDATITIVVVSTNHVLMP